MKIVQQSYNVQCNTYNYKKDQMKSQSLQVLILAIIIKGVINQQQPELNFQILSEGEQVEIPLEEYFQYASVAKINEDRSSNDYKQKFDIRNSSSQPYRAVFDQTLQFQYNGTTIKFNELEYSTTKSLYNHPIKLFLLTNNFVMMLIYKQHCGDDADKETSNQVIGLNLTAKLPAQYLKYKNFTCNAMETLTSSGKDYVYVGCKSSDLKTNYFFVAKIQMTYNTQGFIQGFKFVNYTLAINSSSCQDYNLKLFQNIRVNNQIIPSRIFMYCRKKISFVNDAPILYFYDTQEMSQKSVKALTDCLVNSSYISPNQNGFLSVINKRVYEYYTNLTKLQSYCMPSQMEIDYLFAASRTYNNIQITYFFLTGTNIIIKSSYRTNYQRLQLKRNGYNFTSYALTEHYMALSICNGLGITIMLVYEMEDLFPRLIDERVIQTNQPCNNFLLTSTSNYLQKGYYVFFYNKTTNKLSLKQYNGYTLIIKPKPQILHQSQIIPFKNRFQYDHKPSLGHKFPENSEVYTFCIQSQFSSVLETLIINIAVRKFNDSGVDFFPAQKLKIDSPYVNFNLSSLAVGPLQRFYVQSSADSNIHFQFVNYYSVINISSIIDQEALQKRGLGKVNKLKQIALNTELKLINPVFTLYYSTFIQNCILKYDKIQFTMNCSAENIIIFNSSIQFNESKIIVLSKDKWLQYSLDAIQYCSIVGQSGQCQLLPNVYKVSIKRIKLVRFQTKANGLVSFELFMISSSKLYYGIFKKQTFKTSGSSFNYVEIFTVSSSQVDQLNYMELTNVHYDKYYNHFLLLHLSTSNGPIIKHQALLYDNPGKAFYSKFLGHLIKNFDDDQIQSIMTIDNLLIIIVRQGESAVINEYRITEFYSVFPTRIYPLYGRKIVENGNHVADGQFVFIQVAIQSGSKQGQTEYLVYCPSMITTNVLTHVIPKYSLISFIQEIGSTKSKYPHSIGINGNQLFALSIPNLVIRFDYDLKKFQSQQQVQLMPKTNQLGLNKKVITGNLTIKVLDYMNILHYKATEYQFDQSAAQINYSDTDIELNISSQKNVSEYKLKIQDISGPVMSTELKINSECPFVKKNYQFQDIITQSQCLIEIDSKRYGSILDLKSLHLNGPQVSVEIIITTKHLICVQNHQIITNYNIQFKSCSIVNYDQKESKGLFVCDDGQGSVINFFWFSGPSCYNLQLKPNVTKPNWLVYQFFKMKYQNPYAIFEVPIRVQSNKIYFLTKFDISDINKLNFSSKYQSFIYNSTNQIDHFLTKDFDIDQNYAYLLEDGLGIYDLDSFQDNKKSYTQPLAWLSAKNITQALGVSTQLVYIKPDDSIKFSAEAYNCVMNFSMSIHMEIGTTTHAYRIKICFNDDDQNEISSYEIVPVIQYMQYKDCKNNQLSKSKTWQGYNLTIKLCMLEIQQHRIFSNYMPITPRSSQYYMQFYSINPNGTSLQKIYPFRMEKVSTNDSIQINLAEGQLIIRSLFNFLCYYKMASQIKWSLFLNQTFEPSQDPSQKKQCAGTIVLKNENFVKQINVIIRNTDSIQNKAYKPWIFRCFFIVLCLVSLLKYRLFLQHKKIKMNKLRFNLLSNQFEFQVRVNSKKQLTFPESITDSQQKLQ